MSQPDGQFFFALLSGGLQDRTIVSPFVAADGSWDVIYLRSGSVEVSSVRSAAEEESTRFDAPMILCIPHDPEVQIRLIAGSAGAHLAVNDLAMTTTLGSRPEAIELRVMVSRVVALSLQDLPDLQSFVAFALETIGIETARQSPGRTVIVEAQLRSILIHLWREAYKPRETLSRDGAQTLLLRRFRQLVETHFRERWKVRDYADALNTTPDRLHNITTSVLERTPKELLHERTQREARALLMRSNLTLDQIAAYLGFATTPQFSAYFRKMEGQAPGRYRAASFAQQTDFSIEQDSRFHDWP